MKILVYFTLYILQIKGGVWKNTEDEILKAAVMKYGKNQWARVASLLSRKSAAQCKARWYEWLDPSIKKTEWTKEEEEKLLVLAKTLPNQWRTISPLVGRTAAQCLEHYEQLIDKATGREEDDDPRKLRPGEIDPNPETKPARPDPIDMDDDEKEMLQEARARLASTKGKKAKRKAREKAMEESRRLSALQKKRELKAAGIELKAKQFRKKKRVETDYNRSIPFYRAVPAGDYDTSSEDFLSEDPDLHIKKVNELEEKRRDEEENRLKQKDKARFKSLQKMNLPEAQLQMNQLFDPMKGHKRVKLNLPEPVISENELEEMVKMGVETDSYRENKSLTDSLLGNYKSVTPMMRTVGRTPLRSDLLMEEARNIDKMRNLPTPILGGERLELEGGLKYNGLTPMPPPSATPGRLLANKSATPFSFGTPFRDEFGLNESGSGSGNNASDLWDKLNKGEMSNVKEALRKGLASLPEPQNVYETEIPTLVEEEEEEVIEEDAEELERKREEEEELQHERELMRRSQVLQRDLPRPTNNNLNIININNNIEKLIVDEMNNMIEYDLIKYPIKITKKNNNNNSNIQREEFDDDIIQESKDLINEEIENVKKEFKELIFEDYVNEWNKINDNYIYNVDKKQYMKIDEMNNVYYYYYKLIYIQNEIVKYYEYLYNILKEEMKTLTKTVQKKENKVKILIQGLIKRNEKLREQLNKKYDEINDSEINLNCFGKLHSLEEIGLSTRLNVIESEVKEAEEREYNLQRRYAELMREKETLNSN